LGDDPIMMPSDHLIRLRAAWDYHRAGEAHPRRLELPRRWPAGLSEPFRLTRRFHAPRIEPAREVLALQLEAVEGVTAIRLNGRVLAEPEEGTARLTIQLTEPLPPSNLLELDVDPARWSALGVDRGPWGVIALAVRRV
jgi:hypothetical protein